jgi:hypothetical protein
VVRRKPLGSITSGFRMADKIASAVNDRYSGHSVATTIAEAPDKAAIAVECRVDFSAISSGSLFTAGSWV